MLGTVLYGARNVRYEEVPEPKLRLAQGAYTLAFAASGASAHLGGWQEHLEAGQVFNGDWQFTNADSSRVIHGGRDGRAEAREKRSAA